MVRTTGIGVLTFELIKASAARAAAIRWLDPCPSASSWPLVATGEASPASRLNGTVNRTVNFFEVFISLSAFLQA